MTVLRQRTADLPPPIQMCDALSRNIQAELKTIVANCLAHGRRQFVDLSTTFRSECQYVLETLRSFTETTRWWPATTFSVGAFDVPSSGKWSADGATARRLKRQFIDRLVEPKSALGAAINYLHTWDKLTLFLRVPGAPLDNNVCERALKKAILHRKN